MNGLIKKDFITIKKNTSFFTILILLCGTGLFIHLQGGYGVMMLSLFVLPLLGPFEHFGLAIADDKLKWDKYVIALPITKKDIVRSRYYTCGAILIGLSVFSLLLNIIAAMLLNDFALSTHTTFTLFGLFIGVLYMSILMPCCYKWGIQGASISIVLIMLISGVGIVASSAFDINIDNIINAPVAVVLIGAVILAFVLITVSIKISTFVYGMKHK
jgi:hypothetical protein